MKVFNYISRNVCLLYGIISFVSLRLLKRKVAIDSRDDESERKRAREMKEWQEEQEERADRIFHR